MLASILIPGSIVSNLVIAFYSLAIILIAPTFREALGIGVVADAVCALLSHSLFPPANLLSEPIGAVVCLATYLVLRDRFVLAPAVTTLVATFASGFSFILIAIITVAPTVLGRFGTLEAFLAVTVPIVLITAVVNAVVVQVLEVPASPPPPAHQTDLCRRRRGPCGADERYPDACGPCRGGRSRSGSGGARPRPPRSW